MPQSPLHSVSLTLLGLLLVPGPLHAQDAGTQALTAADQARVIDSMAGVLQARYVYPERVTGWMDSLRALHRTGRYEGASAPVAFGDALTRDLQAVSRDLHLYLRWEPSREFVLGTAAAPTQSAAGAGVVRTQRIDGRDSVTIARTNFAFERVERLPGNVGYLKLNRFVPPDYSRPTAEAAMAFLAHADAVILDLRDNIGGSPELVEFLLGYFLGPDSVLIHRARNRAQGLVQVRYTRADVPGRRMLSTDLYVLTSLRTGSAAESFAATVRRLERGTLIGSRTAGAGHGGSRLSLGHGLALFVPEWLPDPGFGWEGDGVAPHVDVDPEEAVARGYELALERLEARAPDDRTRRERAWALELARAQGGTVQAGSLEPYVGNWGGRRIAAEQGQLVMRTATGVRSTLLPAGEDVFRAGEGTRLRFERDATGQPVALTLETLDGQPLRLTRAP